MHKCTILATELIDENVINQKTQVCFHEGSVLPL